MGGKLGCRMDVLWEWKMLVDVGRWMMVWDLGVEIGR